MEQSGESGEGGVCYDVPCACMIGRRQHHESGDSIRSSVLLVSCLGLMPSIVDAAALHGFKTFCLDLGRFVFVLWCGVDCLPLMDLVRKSWIESGYVDMTGGFGG